LLIGKNFSEIFGANCMKSISASIVVLSGALLLIASGAAIGGFRGMSDIQAAAGIGTLIIGLFVWRKTVFTNDQQEN
jgi:hypothetical protein